jgi:hypothetical protein
MRRYLKTAAVFFFTVGTAFIGVASAEQLIYRILVRWLTTLTRDQFDIIIDAVMYASFSLLLLCLFCLFAFLRIPRSIEIDIGKNRTLQVAKCDFADLVEINRLSKSEFGARTSTMRNLERIFKYSPSSFWKVIDQQNTIRGYFILFSLKHAGEKAIAQEYYYGANPAQEHINTNIKVGSAVCIGAVVGVGRAGRAAALTGLTGMVQSLPQQRIYARPITKAGLALVAAFSFTRLDGSKNFALDEYHVLNRRNAAVRKKNATYLKNRHIQITTKF